MARIFRATAADLAGLKSLRDMSTETFARLGDALAKGPVLLRPSELEAVIATHVSGTSQAVADVLVKLAFTARTSGTKVEDLVNDVTETIRTARPPWSQEEILRWQNVAPELSTFVQHERLRVLAKAIDLKYAHASVYERAQIITDIRPVFDTAQERPAAAIISHTLQVTYNRDGESHTVTMALDDADLSQLTDQATAARRKAEKLLAFLRERVGDDIRLEIAGAQDSDNES